MRKLLTVCVVLLIATTSFAQSIPDEFIGEFMPNLGPVEVEAQLEKWNSPYSIPDSTQSHILFGFADIQDGVASLTFTSIARKICAAPGYCFAVSPTPILLSGAAQWSDYYQTHISIEQHSLTPQFNIIAIRTDTGHPVATWATGMFYLSGDKWLVHPYATYTEYRVVQRGTPLIPYFPLTGVLGVE